jgi:hypothetical protein
MRSRSAEEALRALMRPLPVSEEVRHIVMPPLALHNPVVARPEPVANAESMDAWHAVTSPCQLAPGPAATGGSPGGTRETQPVSPMNRAMDARERTVAPNMKAGNVR